MEKLHLPDDPLAPIEGLMRGVLWGIILWLLLIIAGARLVFGEDLRPQIEEALTYQFPGYAIVDISQQERLYVPEIDGSYIYLMVSASSPEEIISVAVCFLEKKGKAPTMTGMYQIGAEWVR